MDLSSRDLRIGSSESVQVVDPIHEALGASVSDNDFVVEDGNIAKDRSSSMFQEGNKLCTFVMGAKATGPRRDGVGVAVGSSGIVERGKRIRSGPC
jgi:hypothetical protein